MIRNLLSAIFLLLFIVTSGQEVKDAGLWISGGAEKNFNQKFSISLVQEVRFFENITEVGTYLTDLGANYKITGWLKVSANYRFSGKRRVDDTYSLRHRYYFDLSLRQKLKPFTFSYRTRFQSQYSNFHSSDDGNIPEYYSRNKLTVKFSTDKIYEPYVSGELYTKINGKNSPVNDNLRVTLGTEIELNKFSKVDVFYLHQREFNVKRPYWDYIIGLGYMYSF